MHQIFDVFILTLILLSLYLSAEFVGLCENILRNPIPLSYTRHTSRAMLLWLIFLPFAVVSSCQLATIPVRSHLASITEAPQ